MVDLLVTPTDQEDGLIKFPLDSFTDSEWLGSSELLEGIKSAKPDVAEGEETPKLQTLAKGFMFTANKPMAGQHPFYLEGHLIGEDQYAVSANKNGVLTRADIKALRKALKALMNKEKEDFNPNPCADIEPYDDYYDQDSEY